MECEDFYAQHLAEVNEDNAVLATENVLSRQGAIIVPKGAPINSATVLRIATHKLTKPLEQSVGLEFSYCKSKLFEALRQQCARNALVGNIVGNEELIKELNEHCRSYDRYPLLRQKLTVLSMQMPELYQNSLTCAILSVAIAKKMGLLETDRCLIFLAALFHDIGVLHIDPEVAVKTSELSPEEWQLQQGHVVIGKLFLSHVPKLPAQVGELVLQHHERTDGTGYPRKLFGAEIDIKSQVIAMADTIIAVRVSKLAKHNYPDYLLLTLLQLNCNIHFHQVYRAAAVLISSACYGEEVASNIPRISYVLDKQRQLIAGFERLKILVHRMIDEVQVQSGRSLAAMLGLISMSVASSGVLTAEQTQWLQGLERNPSDNECEDLIKNQVINDELYWQIQRLVRLTWASIEELPQAKAELKVALANDYEKIVADFA